MEATKSQCGDKPHPVLTQGTALTVVLHEPEQKHLPWEEAPLKTSPCALHLILPLPHSGSEARARFLLPNPSPTTALWIALGKLLYFPGLQCSLLESRGIESTHLLSYGEDYCNVSSRAAALASAQRVFVVIMVCNHCLCFKDILNMSFLIICQVLERAECI